MLHFLITNCFIEGIEDNGGDREDNIYKSRRNKCIIHREKSQRRQMGFKMLHALIWIL